jgi:hypothetical protein
VRFVRELGSSGGVVLLREGLTAKARVVLMVVMGG